MAPKKKTETPETESLIDTIKDSVAEAVDTVEVLAASVAKEVEEATSEVGTALHSDESIVSKVEEVTAALEEVASDVASAVEAAIEEIKVEVAEVTEHPDFPSATTLFLRAHGLPNGGQK